MRRPYNVHPGRRNAPSVQSSGSYKSAVSRRINEVRRSRGTPVWQRNYYDHVIRDAAALNHIRQYIAENPARWAEDPENPERQPCDGRSA